MAKTTINNCRIIKLNTISREEGKLTVVEEQNDIPFLIRRVYYIYDFPRGATRGLHAHKKLQQVMIVLSGKVRVVLDDTFEQKTYILGKPDEGLIIVNGIWRVFESLANDTICLILASEKYNENDYIREYKDYLKFKRDGRIPESL
jgi:dTDP-4-dehydrorhamnose 3,5-epimerase-like enzyme